MVKGLSHASAPFAIELEECSFSYKNSARASLDGVSLRVPRGQCVAVTGRSGCGKTTLTRLINALIPAVYEGELRGVVRVMGRPVPDWTMGKLSACVGSVFQNPRSQFVNLDVTSEVAFGCESHGIEREEMVGRVGEAAAALGIKHLLGSSTTALSGGQKQSVILASAYAVHPDIYVLDEPTASLDVRSMRRLAKTVASLKRQGKTVIVSEHRLWWLEGLADRYVMLKDGAVEGDWTAEEFAAIPLSRRNAWGLRAASVAEIDASIPSHILPAAHSRAVLSPGENPVVRMRGVVAGYRNAPAVLDGCDFSLEPGRVVGIVGRNGAGKTTLLRCMAGLSKEKAGSVELGGARLRARKRAGKVYLVMQEPGYQLFGDTVDAELGDACWCARGRGSSECDEGIARMKKALALEKLGERHPLSLSGGERQRLSIAVGLLGHAEAVVFDEPTSGLDYDGMRRIDTQIAQMRERGIGVGIVSHDYEFLCSACDEIVELAGGRIVDRFALNGKTLPKLKRSIGFAQTQ
ncbi:MAG: ABC transporter ATP-binding protein [Slackia piriformis]|uniref:ABC transporter ATP-binding protein n=1 Tax=Slackia piriformis TaxID=626934 RepID=A0A943UZG8_9ACTN|nr:ABC transporter ATP-binding protein [Slackia piriformis]